jgi:hypothetical protein
MLPRHDRVIAKGSDGSRVRTHALFRYTVNANGKVTADFAKTREIC